MTDTLVYNADVVSADGVCHGYVAVSADGFISEVGVGNPEPQLIASARSAVDAGGALLMPGAIDCHVHFREPGLTRKATIASESRAAVAGGVTSFIDMPNTVPQTVSRAAVEDKMNIARTDSVANYAFFIGATNDNFDELMSADYSRVAGIKLFMGSSTGNMLVDSSSALERLFEAAPAIISVHAEDEATIRAARTEIEAEYGQDAPVALHTRLRPAEACYRASKRAVELARRYGTRLHIAHLTTAMELDLLDRDCQLEDKLITSEVSPHHLLWTADDYGRLGARIKMNPSVKSSADREALRRAVADGLVDLVATDHAPHLLTEKQGSLFKAVSGAPMVQFSLPTMLELFAPDRVAAVMADNPARLFRIDRRGRLAPGYYADMVLVDRVADGYTVSDSDVLSLCGWTPIDGMTLHHRVRSVWVNGKLACADGVILNEQRGMPLAFANKK